MSTEVELMQSIKTKWGGAIELVCKFSSVPASFMAALIANESGGDPRAKRFEPAVLSSLWQVLLGRKETYGSITRGELVAFVADLKAPAIAVPATLPNNVFQNLDSLACSWGLTQIMGYHCLEPQALAQRPEDLVDAASCIKMTIEMLTEFAKRFSLALSTDLEALLRCWNTGRPDGTTYNHLYVPNALSRMQIYLRLP